jgi:hypothetical protein
LAPAVAEHRDTPRAGLSTAVLVALMILVFSSLRSWGNGHGPLPPAGAAMVALVTGAVIGLGVWRGGTWAGPGWLAQRHLVGRASWVRTDQLVRVRAGGVTEVGLELRDRDGRELSIPWSAVTVSPKLEARVRRDVAISADAGADLDQRSAQILLGRQRR